MSSRSAADQLCIVAPRRSKTHRGVPGNMCSACMCLQGDWDWVRRLRRAGLPVRGRGVGSRGEAEPSRGGHEGVGVVLQRGDLLGAVCATVHACRAQAGGALERRERAQRLEREFAGGRDRERGGAGGPGVTAVARLDESHRHRQHKRERLSGACGGLRCGSRREQPTGVRCGVRRTCVDVFVGVCCDDATAAGAVNAWGKCVEWAGGAARRKHRAGAPKDVGVK